MATPQDVLDFWFLTPEQPGYGKPRAEWFRKDEAFDDKIRMRFGALIAKALRGELKAWCDTPADTLAYVLVLDQFTRNAFRDRPQAFSGDALALEAAQAAVEHGLDLALPPLRRWFLYMPFEHAEDHVMQKRSVTLFTALATEGPGYEDALDYAVRHRDIVARFGRFPHRNAVLGRPSTPEELEFLKLPGSRF